MTNTPNQLTRRPTPQLTVLHAQGLQQAAEEELHQAEEEEVRVHVVPHGLYNFAALTGT